MKIGGCRTGYSPRDYICANVFILVFTYFFGDNWSCLLINSGGWNFYFISFHRVNISNNCRGLMPKRFNLKRSREIFMKFSWRDGETVDLKKTVLNFCFVSEPFSSIFTFIVKTCRNHNLLKSQNTYVGERRLFV